MALIQQKRFLSVDELTHIPAPSWLIQDLFEAQSLVMLAGPPNCYKSFMSLDWQLCLASGRRWNGRRVTPSRVAYILGEGKSSLLKRCQAWMTHNHPSVEEQKLIQENFKVTFEVPQMAAKPSVDNMLASLEAEQFTPNVVVIDTLARSFVGMDENSQKDAGMWIDQAERLRDLGYTVIIIHHTAKNTEFGMKIRGSSVFLGAMDTAMTMKREGGQVTLEVIKQKDHDEGKPMTFQRVIIPLPGDEKGSIILEPHQAIDEGYTAEGQQMEARIAELLLDTTLESSWAKARVLAAEFGLSESAAQSRVSRRMRAGSSS